MHLQMIQYNREEVIIKQTTKREKPEKFHSFIQPKAMAEGKATINLRRYFVKLKQMKTPEYFQINKVSHSRKKIIISTGNW